jgi:uncharacterized protein (TIGR03435 family)
LNADRYDIEATAGGNVSQAVMRGPLLQALLEDRFQLKFHREVREGAVYVLSLAKGGIRMPAMAEGGCRPVDLKNPAAPPAPGQAAAELCGTETRKKNGALLTVNVRGISMSDLADGLFTELAGRPVIDKTGLSGLFQFHVEFSPDDAAVDVAAGPSLFTALREQAGLKLEAGKGPVPMFVVDRVERPGEN